MGWWFPPEDYYEINVREILTNTVIALMKDKNRKFNQAEIYYFERWWKEQTEEVKQDVR